MEVFVMRGLPGSGKSAWVASNHGQPVVCSADHYHMVDGVYRFDPTRAAFAHAQCLKKFVGYVQRPDSLGKPGLVVVDNTNTTVWELAPYMQSALAYGHKPVIVQVHCDPFTAARRNTHGVPDRTVFQMHQNLLTERLPPHWEIRHVRGDE